MGFGGAFTSLWNKASDVVKHEVAKVATTAKQVAGKAVATVEQTAQKTATKVHATAAFVVAQTAKAENTAKQAGTKAVTTAKNQIAKAIEKAKPNVKKAATLGKKVAANAKSYLKQKESSLTKNVKSSFGRIRKDFSFEDLAKAAVKTCPIAKDVYNIYDVVKDESKVFKNDTSNLSKSASGVSIAIPGIRSIKDILDDSTIVYKALRYGPDNPIFALAKHGMRGVSKNVALDIAIGGITGGLNAFARNVDRKDVSRGNLAGIAVVGVAKGVTKAGISAGMGAASGALIGAALGSVIPGPGTAAGAVVGAKLGAAFLSPLFEKPAEWVTNKIFTEKGMGAIAGATIGAALGSIIPGGGTVIGASMGAKLGAKYLSHAFTKPAEWARN